MTGERIELRVSDSSSWTLGMEIRTGGDLKRWRVVELDGDRVVAQALEHLGVPATYEAQTQHSGALPALKEQGNRHARRKRAAEKRRR